MAQAELTEEEADALANAVWLFQTLASTHAVSINAANALRAFEIASKLDEVLTKHGWVSKS